MLAKLEARAELVALVESIDDHPPEDLRGFCIGIGESSMEDIGTKTEDFIEYITTVNVWGQTRSYSDVKEIQEQVRAALHRQALTVDTGKALAMFEIYSDVSTETDGEVRGVQRFRVEYEY